MARRLGAPAFGAPRYLSCASIQVSNPTHRIARGAELQLFSSRGTRELGANERRPPPRFHRSHARRGHPGPGLGKLCHSEQQHVETQFLGETTMELQFSRLLFIGVAGLILGACMTAEEQQAQARAIAANDDAVCRSAGAKPGTPAYVQCRQDRSNQRAIAQREGERSMQRMQWEMNQSAMRQSMPRM
jgi:hypothetical protein